MKTERILIAILVLAVVVLAALFVRQREKPVDLAAEAAAIRAADAEYLKAAQSKDATRFLAFYLDDAVMLPPDKPALRGKTSIGGFVSSTMANPGFAVDIRATDVEVASAGDLAYTLGAGDFTLNDAKGKPVTVRVKDFHVWKKQPDGTWKVVIDIWNPDQPPPAAPVR